MAEQGTDGGKVPETPFVAIGAILIVASPVEGGGVKLPLIAGIGGEVGAGLVGLLMAVVDLGSRWLPVARRSVAAVSNWSEQRVARRAQRPMSVSRRRPRCTSQALRRSCAGCAKSEREVVGLS